jgi:hypothetical protein
VPITIQTGVDGGKQNAPQTLPIPVQPAPAPQPQQK